MADRAPIESGLSCPACGVRVPVRLGPGEECPECRSRSAWESHGAEDRPIVVTHEDIRRVEARRAGEAAGESLLVRLRPAIPSLVAAGLGAAAGVLVAVLRQPRPIGPLAELQSDFVRGSAAACVVGVVALLAAVVALARLRRSRLFRAWWLTGAAALGLLGGAAGVLVGGFGWAAASHGLGWDHVAMPALDPSIATTPFVRAIVDATAVIVAPDEGGDAHCSAIGAGAVVRREPGRAWIVTCSHVAMPYAAVASFRDPTKAQGVWVYLADGRNGPGRVTWTAEPPLDVAVVSFDVEDPPKPVPVSERTEDVGPGDGVIVAVNPMRHGWIVHHGAVSRREPHATPAGRFSLLYTDVPLQPGDSGSGLFDAQGRLIGINTWAGTEGGRPAGISLPSDAMRAIFDSLKAGASDAPPEGPQGR